LVVDTGPSDNRTRQVASSWNAGYAYAPVIGLARARNLGARVCKSEFLAYLDDDSLPEPSWLAELMYGFVDPNVMGVTGPILITSVASQAGVPCALLNDMDLGSDCMVLS